MECGCGGQPCTGELELPMESRAEPDSPQPSQLLASTHTGYGYSQSALEEEGRAGALPVLLHPLPTPILKALLP